MTQYDPNAVQAGQNTRRGCGWILAIVVIALLVAFMAGLVMGLGDDMVTAGKNVGNNIAGLFNPTNEGPTQAEQPADEPVQDSAPVTQEQPEYAKTAADVKVISELDCDWEPGVFGDSLFDHSAQPHMVLNPGNGAVYSSDPAVLRINDQWTAVDGLTTRQGMVYSIYNDSKDPIHISVTITDWNDTWQRPSGEPGRWSIHACVYAGTIAEVENEASRWQRDENKPIFGGFIYSAVSEDKDSIEPTTQPAPTSAPTVQPTTQPQPTSVPTVAPSACVDDAPSGTGPAWISSDPGTLNGEAIPERFTAYIGNVPYALSGMGTNFNVYCGAPADYETNYDKAPYRATIHPDGSVTFVSVSQ